MHWTQDYFLTFFGGAVCENTAGDPENSPQQASGCVDTKKKKNTNISGWKNGAINVQRAFGDKSRRWSQCNVNMWSPHKLIRYVLLLPAAPPITQAAPEISVLWSCLSRESVAALLICEKKTPEKVQTQLCRHTLEFMCEIGFSQCCNPVNILIKLTFIIFLCYAFLIFSSVPCLWPRQQCGLHWDVPDYDQKRCHHCAGSVSKCGSSCDQAGL